MVLLRSNGKALVLQWFCVGPNEEVIVLQLFCLGSNEQALVLQWFCLGSKENIGFIFVLLRVKEKALVLHWCCLGSEEKGMDLLRCCLRSSEQMWFCNGFALGLTKKQWRYGVFV